MIVNNVLYLDQNVNDNKDLTTLMFSDRRHI